MKNSRKLIKMLVERIKQTQDDEIEYSTNLIHKKPMVDAKYVSPKNYKEIVGFYNFIRDNQDLNDDELESILTNNKFRFEYLNKCNDCIFEFISTLRCRGPKYIAKEMTRQGKEIEYINKNLIKK